MNCIVDRYGGGARPAQHCTARIAQRGGKCLGLGFSAFDVRIINGDIEHDTGVAGIKEEISVGGIVIARRSGGPVGGTNVNSRRLIRVTITRHGQGHVTGAFFNAIARRRELDARRSRRKQLRRDKGRPI